MNDIMDEVVKVYDRTGATAETLVENLKVREPLVLDILRFRFLHDKPPLQIIPRRIPFPFGFDKAAADGVRADAVPLPQDAFVVGCG